MSSSRSILRLAVDCRLVLDRPTGIGSYIVGLLRSVLLLSHDMHLTLVVQQCVPPELRAFSTDPRVHFVACPYHYFGFRQKVFAHRCLNKQEADVLLYPHHDVPFFLNMPVVTVIHHVPSLTVSTGPGLLKRLLLLASVGWAVHRAQRVVAVSNYTAKLLTRRFFVPARKIHAIYPPPSPVMFASPGAALPEGLAPSKYFLSVAEWRPHKNLPRLIRAFARIQSELGRDWKLAIAGAPYAGYREPERLVHELGLANHVLLLGKVGPDGLRTLYEHASGLVFVSLLENFGYPVVEAFHFGVPVICSNVGSLPEVAGQGALFVDPYDEKDIARAMLRLARDPELRDRLVEAGRKQLPRFSPEISARETLKVCEEAAGV